MRKTMRVIGTTLAATMVLSMTAMAADTFKIGGIGPVTGPAAAYGTAVKNAMEIAAEEINEAGGINGYQVELNFQDDEHDAEKAITAYNTLKDWGMQILEGTVTSTPCVAVAAETVNDGMFQLTPSGSSPSCITNENAFAVCFSDPAQGTLSAVYIGTHGLAEKVAVIYNSSDVYSTGIYETFMAEAENQPFEVGSAEAFTDDSSTEQATAEQIISADIMIDIYFFITFTSLMMHSSFFVRVYRNLACILSYVKGFLCSIK